MRFSTPSQAYGIAESALASCGRQETCNCLNQPVLQALIFFFTMVHWKVKVFRKFESPYKPDLFSSTLQAPSERAVQCPQGPLRW